MVNEQVAAVIPAFNESASIAAVVAGVKEHATPIVVSDGSKDATADLARSAGAVVVEHPENLGYERALATGFSKANEMGFRFVVTVDADGQHQPNMVGEFAHRLRAGFDLVLGRRDRMQRFAERVFAIVGRWRWGIRDPLCGMKGYAIRRVICAERRYPFDSVGTKYAIHAVEDGAKAVEIEVLTLPRSGRSRFGSSASANIKIMKAMCRLLTTGRAAR